MGVIGKIITTIAGPILGIIDQAVPDTDLRDKLKTQIQLGLATMDHQEIMTYIEAEAKTLAAEIGGHSWLQRNWRPIIMMLFGAVIMNNLLVYPYLSLFFEKAPQVPIPPPMWGLLKIGIGGYILGRSVEQAVKTKWGNGGS